MLLFNLRVVDILLGGESERHAGLSSKHVSHAPACLKENSPHFLKLSRSKTSSHANLSTSQQERDRLSTVAVRYDDDRTTVSMVMYNNYSLSFVLCNSIFKAPASISAALLNTRTCKFYYLQYSSILYVFSYLFHTSCFCSLHNARFCAVRSFLSFLCTLLLYGAIYIFFVE